MINSGCWDPSKAMLMETTKDDYPLWRSQSELILPVGMKFSYKYITTKENSDIVKWEELPENQNREFYIANAGEYIINDEEGKAQLNFVERINNDNFNECHEFIDNLSACGADKNILQSPTPVMNFLFRLIYLDCKESTSVRHEKFNRL